MSEHFWSSDLKLLQELLFLAEDRVEYVTASMNSQLKAAMEKDPSAKQDSVAALVKDMAAKADPTPKKLFITFLARMYGKGGFKVEDFSRLKSDLELFMKVKSKLKQKDINNFKSMDEFYDALAPFENVEDTELMSKGEKERETKKDVDYLIDTPDFKVIAPKTEEAACLYGSGTKWCTAGKTDNMFKHYYDQGPLYIVIAKIDGKQRKFQFHYESDQVMDERDQPIKPADIQALSAIPKYKEFLEKLIKKHYEPLMTD